jgi:hypothetical protein
MAVAASSSRVVAVAQDAAPTSAPTTDLAALWLVAGDHPPEGQRNPDRRVVPGDLGLIGVGGALVGVGYVVAVVTSVAHASSLYVYTPYGFGSERHPCADGAMAAAFVPVLGPWLAIGALDQCGIGIGPAYVNSFGGAAWISIVDRTDLGVDTGYAIVAAVSALAQTTGLALLVVGVLGHRTTIEFQRASLSMAPLASSSTAGFAATLSF